MADQQTPPVAPEQNPEPQSFESWLEGQDETVRGLIEGHTKGLKGALDSEREQRKSFEKQLRDAAAKVEKGSEAEKQLTALADQASTATKKADFYEVASAAGCTNLRLAWLAVSQDESLVDRGGNVRIEALKAAYPELFRQAGASRGNAGAGTGGQVPTTTDMNSFIRRAAGR